MKLLQIRLPTLLALLLLVCGMGATIYLVERGPALFSNATDTVDTNQIKIINVTENSFSVSWLTPTATKGVVRILEQKPWATPQTAYDIRDTNFSVARHTHFVTAKNLKPNTTYEVEVLINNKSEKLPLITRTGSDLSPPQHVIDPAFGTLSANDKPVVDGLVYVSFLGSQTLGGLVDPDGSWVVPLGHARTEDLKYYFVPTPQDEESISFESTEGVLELKTTTDYDSPLHAKYLQRGDKNIKSSTISPMVTIAQTKTVPTVTDSINSVFKISLPKHNSSLTTSKPAFKGVGTPGKKVTITVIGNTKPISGSTTTAVSGTWNWTPPNLEPGAYSATVSTFNQNDKPIALSVNFTILKSGSQVLQAATPSASLLPSPTSQPSSTPTSRPSPSSDPNATVSASPIPITGNTTTTNFLLIISSMTILLGAGGLVIKTKH